LLLGIAMQNQRDASQARMFNVRAAGGHFLDFPEGVTYQHRQRRAEEARRFARA
jgi:hypothetical protein